MTARYVNSGNGAPVSPYTSWANAATKLSDALTLSTAGGDIVYVDSTHNENLTANTDYGSGVSSANLPVQIISATNGTTTPAAGAAINSNGSRYINLGGNAYYYGIAFKVGTGTEAGAYFTIDDPGQGLTHFDKCSFNINSNSSTPHFYVGSNSSQKKSVVFRNCTFQFGQAAQAIYLQTCNAEFYNLILAGTAQTTLFRAFQPFSQVLISGSNLSGGTNLIERGYLTTPFVIKVNNCKIPSVPVIGATSIGASYIELMGCTVANDAAWEYWKYTGEGSVTPSGSIYLTTGGASTKNNNGTTVYYSHALTPTTAQCDKSAPLYSPWYYKNNSLWHTADGAKTVSLKIAHTESAVLKDADVWLEIEYMGGAAPADLPVTQLETSAPAIGSTVARDVTAAGSNLTDHGVPAGDSADPWTGIAEKAHTLSKSITFAEYGVFRVRVGLGKVTTSPVYVDPLITVA